MKIRTLTIALQRLFRFSLIAITLALLPVPFPGMARAEEPAGKVNAVAGQVTAAGADGAIRTLAKDAPFFSGDIISTGPNSRVRLIFSDDGVIFLRPSTRFEIKSYRHSGDLEQDESKFSLLRGGFRSITGAIGHGNTKKYEVKTPVATIGIRGTDHEGRFCAGDCLDLTDIGVSPPADGLYTGTNTGETLVGGQKFKAGQYGFTSPAGQTLHLPEPPPILAKDPLLSVALTDKGAKATEKEPAGDKQQTNQDKQTGQDKPTKQAQEKSATDGGKDTPPAEEGFEIPAKPPTTRMIECK
ncbi:MAG: FecR domain-containing protein [Desulfobulbaceae bacterium]|nr:FecR domain-containing protein [Desulfobulbaceae bacterium]